MLVETFLFEFVGEVVTKGELDAGDRTKYVLNLNADWKFELTLDEEECLSIDATEKGNICRFLNHRFVVCSVQWSIYVAAKILPPPLV